MDKPTVTSPASPFERDLLLLDESITQTLVGIKQMEAALTGLLSLELHPEYKQILTEIDGLIQEALIPYLDQADTELRKIADI